MRSQSEAITARHHTKAGGAAEPAMKAIGAPATNFKYIDRHAVRLVIKDSATQEIVIIFVRKGSYYKLPGEGIEAGEDYHVATIREHRDYCM